MSYKESLIELRSNDLHANWRRDPIKLAKVREGREDLIIIILSRDDVGRSQKFQILKQNAMSLKKKEDNC